MYSNFSARALGLNLTAAESIGLAAAAGFDAVELPVRDLVLAGSDASRLRAKMDDLGLRGGTWPLPVDWRNDAQRFARDLQRLDSYAEAAAILGLTRTGTWVMPETTANPVTDFERAMHLAETAARHVRRLGAIARVLDRHGIRFGLEVIGVASSRTGRGLPFVHRLADFDRVLGALWNEAPNVGILLDGFHLYAAGEGYEAGLAWGVGRVVAVHVADLPATADANRAAINDQQRGLPGENGAIDSRELLTQLARQGYDGPVTAEPMAGCRSLSGRSPESSARLVAAALQAVWPSTGSLQREVDQARRPSLLPLTGPSPAHAGS
ncbi:MAG: sugar phosphate isomerase/epimerase [Isosphaeraceae bacterium]|nr:sugar phosphate isomerase/epimerase [Isosphaeraceae bacterium]